MNLSIQHVLGKILIQFVIVLLVFVGFVSAAKAELSGQLELNISHRVSQNISDKRLAGMLRSTIAFDRRLAQQQITVKVTNAIVSVSGQLENQWQQDILVSIIQQTVGKNSSVVNQAMLLTKKN